MYKSLKEGWISLSDLADKYGKDRRNVINLLGKVKNKEKVGNTWIVKESEIIQYIKTDIQFEESFEEIIDNFTEILITKIDLEEINAVLRREKQSDALIHSFLEWSIRAEAQFPIKLYNKLKDNDTYVKYYLIISLWNKALKNSKQSDKGPSGKYNSSELETIENYERYKNLNPEN